MLLLHGIQALDSLIILQRFFLALNLCNNLLLRRRMWLEGITLEKFLIRIRILNQTQSHALILIYIMNVILGLRILRKNWVTAEGLALPATYSDLPCSRPPWRSISKIKLQFYQLSKPYKIDDYSGASERCISVFLYSFHIDGFTEKRCFQGLWIWPWKFPMGLIFNPLMYQWS